jgi:iron complex outermembrane receptor protein
MLKGLSFIGGLRYTRDNLSFGGRTGYLTGQISPTTEEVRQGAPSWTLGLNYQTAPGSLVYLTSRRGYRSGGQNGYNSAGQLQPFYSPEYVQDVELGVKSDWNLGGIPVRTNADVYYEFYTDLQTTSQYINPATLVASTTIQNDSDARVWGVEVETLAQLTKDFQIGPSYDFMSFVYTNFASNVTAAQIALLNADVKSHGPQHKYGVTALYHLPFGPGLGDVSLRASYMWQSMTASTGVNSATDVYNGGDIPSYGLLNVSAEWDNVLEKRFDLSLFCTNTTNELYVAGARSLYAEVAFGEERFGAPRMYGVRLRYHF